MFCELQKGERRRNKSPVTEIPQSFKKRKKSFFYFFLSSITFTSTSFLLVFHSFILFFFLVDENSIFQFPTDASRVGFDGWMESV